MGIEQPQSFNLANELQTSEVFREGFKIYNARNKFIEETYDLNSRLGRITQFQAVSQKSFDYLNDELNKLVAELNLKDDSQVSPKELGQLMQVMSDAALIQAGVHPDAVETVAEKKDTEKLRAALERIGQTNEEEAALHLWNIKKRKELAARSSAEEQIHAQIKDNQQSEIVQGVADFLALIFRKIGIQTREHLLNTVFDILQSYYVSQSLLKPRFLHQNQMLKNKWQQEYASIVLKNWHETQIKEAHIMTNHTW